MSDIDALNERFGIVGEARFEIADHGAAVLSVTNERCTGSIAIQGAQILTWTPTGAAPVVWLSSDARFKPGKSLRGGAPVCWPWFGPHPSEADRPNHGFARNLDWEIDEVSSVSDGTRVVMSFTPGEAERAIWPHTATLRLTVLFGDRLYAELETHNTGPDAFALTQALHTYFHVGDIAQVQVDGLEGCGYVDKTRDQGRFVQEGPITIDREVDRIYLDCPGEVAIVDAALGRRIRISKTGSRSTVVWNPWAEVGAKFGDMGEDGYRHMICVETTNAGDDLVTVGSGDRYRLTTEYALESV